MDKLLITICARGGSKGVINKNIREINGKPLISYTIAQALSWGQANRVVVSTDSAEIAKVAKDYGADVPFIRPKNLASDSAAKLPVIRHALQQCEKEYQEEYDIIVDLDATAPIRAIVDLENCFNLFRTGKYSSLFSVVIAHKNPYFNMVEINKAGYIEICKLLDSNFVRRQDAPKVYSLNASIYFYQREYLLKESTVSPISSNSAMYIMEDIAGVDIDREVDYKYIEFLIKENIVAL